MEADRADRADGDGSEYKVLEVVQTVRTCQNLLGQNGTCLGLLLLHVGLNGDGFGGQAFMEHYTISLPPLSSPTLPMFICIPPPHLCTISRDRA
jgi:hypothetical protein